MLRYLIALFSILLVVGSAHADGYEEARSAANRGEFATAFSIWKSLADKEDARAQFALGRMYARGDGVRQDFVTARGFFEAAVSNSHGPAMLALGKMYFYGDGVGRDPIEAYVLFSHAAASGVEEAALFVRKLKPSVREEEIAAREKLPLVVRARVEPTPEPVVVVPTPDRAALESTPTPGFVIEQVETPVPVATPTPADPLAPYRSALLNSSNSGSRSFRFDPVAEAIISSFPGGMNLLSVYASSLFYGPLITDEKAIANTLSKATNGDAESQNTMGFAALYAGNPELAQTWFQKSGQQGNGTALFCLGNFAFNSNYERAAALYQEAAEKGVAAAKRNLGYFLIRGIGVDQNKERGRVYLTDASKLGDTLATDLLK